MANHTYHWVEEMTIGWVNEVNKYKSRADRLETLVCHLREIHFQQGDYCNAGCGDWPCLTTHMLDNAEDNDATN